MDQVFKTTDYPYCTFYGNVRDRKQMETIYQKSDVLLLTSAFEGLPIAIMEMMAYSKVVVSTAVDGIPDYITSGENGFLLENHPDEDKIIEDGIAVLTKLSANRILVETIGHNSRMYAEKNFSEKVFRERYEEVLFGGLAE